MNSLKSEWTLQSPEYYKNKYPVGTRVLIPLDEDDPVESYAILDKYHTEDPDEFHLTFDDNSEGWYSFTEHMEFLETIYTFIPPPKLPDELFEI